MQNISRFTVGLVLISVPFLLVKAAYADTDRDATPEENTKIVEVLKQNNCTLTDDIDYIEGIGFKAEDVQCDDGKVYDVFLDDNFNITSRREDLDWLLSTE